MPWVLLPALLLVTLEISTRDWTFAWMLQSFFIPMSAWIGYRYGRDGMKVVLAAAVIAVLFRASESGDIRIGFGLVGSFAFSGFLLAWLLSDQSHLTKLKERITARPNLLWWALLLPISYVNAAVLSNVISTGGQTLVFTSFFIVGYIANHKIIIKSIVILFVMVLIGIALYALYQASPDYRDLRNETGILRYMFLNPAAFLFAAICLFSGAWVQHYVSTGQWPFAQSKIPFGVIILGFLVLCVLLIRIRVSSAVPEFEFRTTYSLTGHRYFLAFCFFLAGVFYGLRGFLYFILPVFLLVVFTQSEFFPGVNYSSREGLFSWEFRWDPLTVRYLWWLPHLFLWTVAGDQLRKIATGVSSRQWEHSAPDDGPGGEVIREGRVG